MDTPQTSARDRRWVTPGLVLISRGGDSTLNNAGDFPDGGGSYPETLMVTSG